MPERYKDFCAALCEFAHPNSLGTFYAYARVGDESSTISFGHNKGLTRGEDLAFAVVFALEILLESVRKTDALVPQVAALADLYRSA